MRQLPSEPFRKWRCCCHFGNFNRCSLGGKNTAATLSHNKEKLKNKKKRNNEEKKLENENCKPPKQMRITNCQSFTLITNSSMAKKTATAAKEVTTTEKLYDRVSSHLHLMLLSHPPSMLPMDCMAGSRDHEPVRFLVVSLFH